MTVSTSLVKKLNPRRFTEMSPKMAAIVGHVLNQSFTKPRIIEMAITSDDCVMGGLEGDIGLNEFMGSGQDLRDNWTRLLDVAGLTQTERDEAEGLFVVRIADHRPIANLMRWGQQARANRLTE